MAATIPVGTVPIKISGTASKPYLITNDPANQTIIYLGQDSSVSPYNYGVKLLPGASLTWTEITREVWAVSATTQTANVTVLYEATATFSSQVSTLSGSSPVLLSTKTVNVQLNGVTGSAQTVYVDSVNIASFTSIKVMVSTTVNNTGGVTTTSTSLDANAYVQFTGVQADTPISNANFYGTNNAVWTLGTGSNSSGGNPAGLVNNIRSYEFPVNNIYLTGDSIAGTGTAIRVSSGTITAMSLTVTVRIYGTSNTVATEKYYNGATGGFSSGLGTFTYPQWGVMATIGSSSSTSYTIPSQNGLANVNLAVTGVTATAAGYVLNFFTLDFLSAWAGNIGVGTLTTPAVAFTGSNQNFIFPNVPVRVTTTYAGSGQTLAIIQEKR